MSQIRFSTAEASNFLGFVPIATLRKSRVSGTLYGTTAPRYKKIGNKVFYEKVELEKWLANIPNYSSTSQINALTLNSSINKE